MSVAEAEAPTVTQSFQEFVNRFNENYVLKLKDIGQKQEYTIDINDKPVTFVRKRLTTRAFNELEASRGKVER